jgi:hypothetical protein
VIAKRTARWPLLVVACFVLGALVRLPALRASLFFDDIAVAAMHHGECGRHGPFDLGVYATGDPTEHAQLVDQGLLPWWLPPDSKAAPFRPLASALIWLELDAVGPRAFPLHLLGLLWWGAVIAGAASFFRRTLPPRAAALALILYAVAQAHAVPSVWIAGQSGWMATAGAAIALAAFVRQREAEARGLPTQRWIAPLALALGLLGGEYALGALGFVLAYELFVARDCVRARARALAPLALTVAAYVVAYKALGRGARAAAGYVDPLREPARFAARVGESLGTLATTGGLGLDRGPTPGLAIALPATLAFALTIALCLRGRPRRVALFLAVGAVLAFVPTAGAPYGTRLLLMPSLGLLAAASLALVEIARALREGARDLRTIAGVALASVLVLAHLFSGAYASHDEAARTAEVSRALVRMALATPDAGGRTRVLIAGPDPFARGFAALVPPSKGPHTTTQRLGWFPISPHGGPHTLLRLDERTLLVATPSPFARAAFVDGLDVAALAARSPVRAGPLTIEVLELASATRLRVRFAEPLERYQLLIPQRAGFGEITPPPPGQRLVVYPGAEAPPTVTAR